MQCWRTNKERYRREYFEKGRKLDTRELRFGKSIAKMIENRDHHTLLPNLILYPWIEFEIRTDVRGVPILSFLDTCNHHRGIFREFKTGKVGKDGNPPWTQAKVQKHDQLLFYAVALRAKTGEMPRHCHLDWIETVDNPVEEGDFWSRVDRDIKVTGNIKSFQREFDKRELDRMEEEIEKIALEISDAYRKFINEI